jgi:hypothetical protein
VSSWHIWFQELPGCEGKRAVLCQELTRGAPYKRVLVLVSCIAQVASSIAGCSPKQFVAALRKVCEGSSLTTRVDSDPTLLQKLRQVQAVGKSARTVLLASCSAVARALQRLKLFETAAAVQSWSDSTTRGLGCAAWFACVSTSRHSVCTQIQWDDAIVSAPVKVHTSDCWG